MADYNSCFLFVMNLEDAGLTGRVTETPGDAGGRTRFGIAQNFASGLPDDFYTTSRDSALSDAKLYYKRMYWDRVSASKIVNDKIAAQFFSIAVNIGVRRATLLMQRVLGVEQDGVVGNLTLQRLNAYSPIILLGNFNNLVQMYYREVVSERPQDAGFLRGWLDRVMAIYKFPLEAL